MMRTTSNETPLRPGKSETSRSDDTRAAILQAAEDLFAERGLADTTLRAITERAGVNLASVNYHFRTKHALTMDVMDALSIKINDRRIMDLEAILTEAERTGKPPALRDIISAFIRPYVRPEPGENSLLLAKLLLQHRLSPSQITSEIIERHFDPMAKRFVDALLLACPHVSRTRMHWRYVFMIGAVIQPMTESPYDQRLRRLSEGLADMRDRQTAWEEMIDFLSSGLSAP